MRKNMWSLVVCIVVALDLIGCGSSGGNNADENNANALIGTWFHSATASSSNQTLTLTATTWENNDAGNGGCIETGTYTYTSTAITFKYGSNGGCNGEAANSTLVANYTVTSTTLNLYDSGNGTLMVDYVKQNSSLPGDSVNASSGYLEITKSTKDVTGSAYRNILSSGEVSSISAVVKIVNYSADGAMPRARVRGVFYNDGSAGAAAGSSIGDINAGLNMTNSEIRYQIVRCTDTTCTNATVLFENQLATVNVNDQHRLSVNWDKNTDQFSFQIDSNSPVTVDPTTLAPVISSTPNRPFAGLGVKINATSGQSGTMTARFDDVYVNNILFDDFSSNSINPSKWFY